MHWLIKGWLKIRSALGRRDTSNAEHKTSDARKNNKNSAQKSIFYLRRNYSHTLDQACIIRRQPWDAETNKCLKKVHNCALLCALISSKSASLSLSKVSCARRRHLILPGWDGISCFWLNGLFLEKRRRRKGKGFALKSSVQSLKLDVDL